MKWVDSLEIAIALEDKYPEVDPISINFVKLRDMVMTLDDFDDDANRSGERILEAIQEHWISEK